MLSSSDGGGSSVLSQSHIIQGIGCDGGVLRVCALCEKYEGKTYGPQSGEVPISGRSLKTHFVKFD
jgi:hypothetical protein